MNKIAVMGTNPRVYINKSLLNEDWAVKLHGQTLDELASRGGLSHKEVVLNVEKLPLKNINSFSEYYAVKLVEKLAIKSINLN